MIERIRIEVDPRYDVGGDATRHCARVLLIAQDGRRCEREALERPGSPANPLSLRQLERKFETLAAAVLPGARIAKVIDAVAALDDNPDVRSLVDLVVIG